MTAPIASGRSDSCRVGFAPTEERRLTTAHTLSRHLLDRAALQKMPKFEGLLRPVATRSTALVVEQGANLLKQVSAPVGFVDHVHTWVQRTVMHNGVLGVARGVENLDVGL